MSEVIATNYEIALYTGLTVSDAKLTLFNASMTSLLAEVLGVSEFGVHSVALELVRVDNKEAIRLRSFPFDIESIELLGTYSNTELLTGYTFRVDPYDIRRLWILDDGGIPTYLNHDEVYVNYDAGYILQDTLTVIDYAALVGKTIVVTVAGVATTYTFVASGATGNQINAATSDAVTATNIATKFGTSAVGDSVTLPVGSTIAYGTAIVAELTFVNSNVPSDLKMAIAYLVAGAITDKTQIEGISSYKIGTKNVTLRDPSEKSFIDAVLDKYLIRYKKINVIS